MIDITNIIAKIIHNAPAIRNSEYNFTHYCMIWFSCASICS